MNVVEENINKIIKLCKSTGKQLSNEEINKLKEKHYKAYIKYLETDIKWYEKENNDLREKITLANERIAQLSEMLEV